MWSIIPVDYRYISSNSWEHKQDTSSMRMSQSLIFVSILACLFTVGYGSSAKDMSFQTTNSWQNWFHRGSTMYKAVLEARAKQQALESIVRFTAIVADVSMVSFNKGRINEWVPVWLDVWEGQRSFPTRWEEERKCSHSRLLSPLPWGSTLQGCK